MKKIFTLLLMSVMTTVAAVAADFYTVAGVSAIVNGAEWDPANTANDMTSTDGKTYTLTVSGKTLKQGVKYEYKVVEDHAWTVSYPQSGNTGFNVPENGIYDITYTYVVGESLPTAVATKVGDADIKESVFSVIGTINGSWDTDTDMTKGEDGIFRAEFTNVAAGTYKFKVRADHAWTEAYPGSDYSLTVEQDNSTVVIAFNPTSKEVTATVTVATGIETVKAESKSSTWYNMAGQRISSNAKGMVIMNGKKYIAK